MSFDSGVEAMMGPSEVKAWIVGASMVGEGKVSGGEEKEGRAQDPPVHCLVRFWGKEVGED